MFVRKPYTHLHITLDKIERSEGGVSETTAEASTEGTGSVESRGIHLQFLGGVSGRRNGEGVHGSGEGL